MGTHPKLRKPKQRSPLPPIKKPENIKTGKLVAAAALKAVREWHAQSLRGKIVETAKKKFMSQYHEKYGELYRELINAVWKRHTKTLYLKAIKNSNLKQYSRLTQRAEENLAYILRNELYTKSRLGSGSPSRKLIELAVSFYKREKRAPTIQELAKVSGLPEPKIKSQIAAFYRTV